ncbi:hypothetical protein HNQ85_001862 [Anoxybacillus calidus]|uniref:Uncharacterized protein n=1 Tax=[Anoxybacillus] calidus TaxID=575178 RepID=A0A7V9Z0B2_9BACL|nr:hypothetical protein [Anoxybacillus calidus]
MKARLYKKICQYCLVMKKLGIMEDQQWEELKEALKRHGK